MTTQRTTSFLCKKSAYGFLTGSLFSFLSLYLAEGLGESGLTRAMTRDQYSTIIWGVCSVGVVIALGAYARHRKGM